MALFLTLFRALYNRGILNEYARSLSGHANSYSQRPIGCKVTMRADRMWEFLDRLIDISLPRVRDFRGLNGKSFDGRGNYSMGVKEQIIFPEIEYDKVDKIRGMDITITTTANTNEEGHALLKALNFPFRN